MSSGSCAPLAVPLRGRPLPAASSSQGASLVVGRRADSGREPSLQGPSRRSRRRASWVRSAALKTSQPIRSAKDTMIPSGPRT